jgi:hemoglobin-like flavoprotein
MNSELLETSIGLVDAPDDGLTRRFYEILFERYPDVRPMFSEDIRPQARMLRKAVVAVLGHLDDRDWLASTLEPLGARHAGWGVTPAMYDAVAECMIAAMADLGGSAWTQAMTDAWMEALAAIAGLMITGAAANDVEVAS